MRLTDESVYSSLPTPLSRDWKESGAPHYRGGVVQTDNVPRAIFQSGEIVRIPADSVMRTPSVTDSTGGAISEKQARERRRMVKTADQVAELAYMNGLPVSESIAESLSGTEVAASDTFTYGKFTPAIRRWEATIGREAPAPTIPDGRNGGHRLHSKFSEWMMGLPDGWITGHGLKRVAELKLAGNGVVPQQAEYAINNMVSPIIGEIKNG